jgi:uncharacterized membrane protein YgcG
VRAGSAFTAGQKLRLDHAAEVAGAQSGLLFSIVVGPSEGDPRENAERLLAGVVDGRNVGAVLVLVDPDARQLEIVTNAIARRRVDDQACALAALSMTTSFTVGDLAGGVVNGLRMLADAAGRKEPAPAEIAG